MVNFTNKTKTLSSVIAKRKYGISTWDDNVATWDDALFSWDSKVIAMTNKTKNVSTIINKTK